MGYSAKALANFFIKNYTNISPLKIQKLVYISHGWHLGLFDEPLVDDEFAKHGGTDQYSPPYTTNSRSSDQIQLTG